MAPDESGIHYEDPFATPAQDKQPARRLRGRFAHGVSVWTAGAPEQRAGLAVSSMVIADGEPAMVAGLIGDMTDLYEVVAATGRFVVHLLDASQARLADRFAGLFPSPGGLFADLELEDTAHGPALSGIANRAYCTLVDMQDCGYQRLVNARIDRIEMSELSDPLVYFRGKYRKLAP